MTWEERIEVQQACLKAYPPVFSRAGLTDCFSSIFAIGSCIAVLLAIPVGLLYLVLSHLRLPTSFLGWLAAAGALGGAVLSWRQMRKEGAKRAVLCAQELTEGMAEVVSCTVHGAVEITDVDGDPAYFLDVGDSRILCLYGDVVRESAGESRFPNSDLRWARTPLTGLTLSFDCLGEPLLPFRQIEPDYETSEALPQHGEIFPGTLDTLEEDLRQYQASRSAGN